LLTNAAVLTVAARALAVTPATVSFPIAVAEALALAAGPGGTLAVNLALLPRALHPARSADRGELLMAENA
jgi:hypothetical protein